MSFTESSGLSSPASHPSDILEAPSSPLSQLSRSPSPPTGFLTALFTPPPSQDAGEEMPRPRKRRKIERSERTTRYLDLTDDSAQSQYDYEDALQTLRHALRKRRKIVVIAGAGISVTAGIPDFRSADGLFAGLQKEHRLKGGSGKQLFDASVYKDATLTSQFHDMVRKLSNMSKCAKPTRFHEMLARLAKEGRLMRLYTQNVDGLETQMQPLSTEVPLPHKGPWPQTVQLHGGLEKMMCQKCRVVMDFDPVLFDGAEPPTCPKCREQDAIRTDNLGKRSHGIGRLRPRIVLYNEQNPDEEAIGAVSAADMRARPDAIVVVGTSMKIPGVRRIVSEMCKIVRGRREGTTIWINPDPEPSGPAFENCWDLIIKGGSDQVAQKVNLRHWEDPNMQDDDILAEYTDSDIERVKLRQGEVRVNIPASPVKKPAQTVTVMTPPRSNNGDSQEAAAPTSSQKSPTKITLKVGAKSQEAEKARLQILAQKPQQKSHKQMKIKNPASDGRVLTDVLGRENVVKNRKPKTTRKPKVQDQTCGLKNFSMKSTKAAKLAIGVSAKKSGVSASSEQSNSRNLGKLVTPELTGSTTSPQQSPEPHTPKDSSNGFDQRHCGSPRYDRLETISPKSVPRGMADLLS